MSDLGASNRGQFNKREGSGPGLDGRGGAIKSSPPAHILHYVFPNSVNVFLCYIFCYAAVPSGRVVLTK